MNDNRMTFDELMDVQELLAGLRQLEQANDKFVNSAVTQNERYRQSIVHIREEMVRQREIIISLNSKDRRLRFQDGLPEEINRNVQALRTLQAAIERNKQLFDLNTASVTQIKQRLADLKQEYDNLERSEAQNVQRMNEIQREIRETGTVLSTLTQATSRAARAADAAENSYERLNKETGELRATLRSMPDAFDLTTGKINRHNKAAVEMHEVIQRNDKVLKTMDGGMGNYQRRVGDYGSALAGMGRSALLGVAGLVGVTSVLEGIQTAIRITSDLERLDAGLRAVSKDSADFANTQNFLMSLADSLGQRYDVLAKSYKGLKAATRDTSLEGKATEKIFAGIVRAGSALQLSNEEIEGSLYAVTQMISKGKVQAEELRQQLGERLPGAMKLLAQSMGISEARLNIMLEKGELLAVDVLPKLATQLDKTFGADASKNLDTMGGNMNSLTNEVTKFFGAMNQNKVITNTVNTFLGGIRDMLRGLRGAIESNDWKTFFGAAMPNLGVGIPMFGGGAEARAQLGRYAENDRILSEFRTMDAGLRKARLDMAKEEETRLQKELDKQKDSVLGGNKAKLAGDLANQRKLLLQLQRENLKLEVKDRKDADQEIVNTIRAGKEKQEQALIDAEKKKGDVQRKADQELQRRLSLSQSDTGVKLSKASNDKEDGLITEKEFIQRRYDITLAGIQERQKLLQQYGKQETDDYRDLAREKLDAETQFHRDSYKQQLSAAKLETETRLKELAIQREDGKITEADFINQRFLITQQGVNDRLKVLRDAGLEESQLYKEINNETLDAQREQSREQRKLDEKNFKEAVRITKESLQAINDEQRSSLDERLADLNDWYEQQQQLVELQNAKGLVSDSDASVKLYELKKEYLQRFVDAQVDSIRGAEQLEQQRLGELFKSAKTEEEREQVKQLIIKNAREAQIDVDKAIADNRIKQSDAATKKEIDDARKVKEAREQSLENYKQAALDAVNAVFENQNQATQNYMTGLEKQKEQELEAAGNNANAKKAIEERYESQVRAIRRRQAISEKLQGAFTIGINTAMAVTKALASAPPPANIALAASIGVLGAVQLAAVLSKPIPAYKDGKNMESMDSYSGPALVGEAGRELWISDGKAKMVDRPSIVNVGKDDVILSNQITERLLKDDNAMEANRLLHRHERQQYSATVLQARQRPVISGGSLNQAAITQAIKAGFSDLELHQWNVLDGELTDVVVNGNQRRINRSRRHKLP